MIATHDLTLAELIVLAALAGTVGVLVLLRRPAFMTDALTHTVFPGVVVGYLFSGEGGIFWGALAAGLLTAVLLTLLTRHRAVAEDTALAVLLTTFVVAAGGAVTVVTGVAFALSLLITTTARGLRTATRDR